MNESFREVIDRSYYGATTLHQLGLAITLLAGFALLMLPRRYAVWPLLFMAVFVSSAQRVVIAGIDLDLLRVMTLFGIARIVMRGEIMRLRLKAPDVALLTWLALGLIVYVIRVGDTDAFIYRSGWVFDGVGMYFLLRCLVQKWSDVDRVVLGIIVLSVPIMVAFVYEQITHHNVFSIFGGVPAQTMMRDGRLRCQGAFTHPIMAGTFWAAMLPIVIAWYFRGGAARWQSIIGVGCSLVIIYTCASSGPLMSVFFGLIGMSMYMLRHWMSYVRWIAAGMILTLHLIMEKPVWHLLARIEIVGGSTGYHRYKLIDEAVRHFSQWWMLGTDNTASWATDMSDITNQYVLEGIRGGVVSLVAFLVMIWLCFASVGRLWRASSSNEFRTLMSWALGVTLFVHVVTFFSVSYFGQINVVWMLSLAMIVSLSPTKRELSALERSKRKLKQQRQAAHAENKTGNVSQQEQHS